MISKIEQIIGEIEEYIESCKPQLFNGSNIIVDKETMEELLTELRLKAPEEIKRYQKIISNKEAIMANAEAQAQELLEKTQLHSSELVSEHEIMQQAYAQANEVVMVAKQQAQEILDNATNDANAIRMGAISYTDDMLGNIEELLSRSIETTQARTAHLVDSLQEYLNVVTANRGELLPQAMEQEQQMELEEEANLELPYSSDSDGAEQ